MADRMPGQIPDAIKNRRSDVLMKIEEEMSDEYRMSYVGKKCLVLFEEKVTINGEEYYVGHTDTYVKTAVKSSQPLENVIAGVEITGKLTKNIMLAGMKTIC
ncbi:MAG: hypothetical protein PUF12_06385 [Thermoflexaceae bacterium]|nr:hypothetical protein [Thermoflexaceae bacterium]